MRTLQAHILSNRYFHAVGRTANGFYFAFCQLYDERFVPQVSQQALTDSVITFLFEKYELVSALKLVGLSFGTLPIFP